MLKNQLIIWKLLQRQGFVLPPLSILSDIQGIMYLRVTKGLVRRSSLLQAVQLKNEGGR